MASGAITVRVLSPQHGTRRITAKSNLKIDEFFMKVKDEFKLPVNGWKIWTNRDKSREIVAMQTKTLSTYNVKHGDMVFLDIDVESAMATEDSASSSVSDLSTRTLGTSRDVVEDDVDQFLWKQDGKIPRERNEQLCHHGPSGKCFHCVPLEPYDEDYLAKANPPIKFLSFHSYLRKLTGGVDKGKFAMLENISCKIKPGCLKHPPWPGGICTKCQPTAVTLQRQKYRHVDYIQFENTTLIQRFLDYWRKTGNQRIGFLYGRYEAYDNVPLGIKAVVTAIYEPQQVGTKNSVELVEFPSDEVNRVAEQLGLSPVGWIFTDLVPQDTLTGTVKYFRGNINSHFLSAEECIMAADLQTKHPNACRLSPDGHFGSKFVTVVATGDAENKIHFEGYQVSNQGMALVSDDCFIPTRDAPELGYVKESSNEQYVPDVFYTVTDSYGNDVTRLARPLPVEYLLVDMPAAFPVSETYTFNPKLPNDPSTSGFTIANREDIGELQNFMTFCEYMHHFSRNEYMTAMCDFHLLVFLATCDMLPLKEQMAELLASLRSKDEVAFHRWTKTEAWATVEQLMDANVPSPSSSMAGPSLLQPGVPASAANHGAAVFWSCQHCTFHNQAQSQTCEMCGLPRQ